MYEYQSINYSAIPVTKRHFSTPLSLRLLAIFGHQLKPAWSTQHAEKWLNICSVHRCILRSLSFLFSQFLQLDM